MQSLGAEVRVVWYENYEPSEDILVFGGGPGDINDFLDQKMNTLRKFIAERGNTPLLGICLWCQAICQHLGIEVKKLPQALQGVQREAVISPNGKREKVGHYNSLAGAGFREWCDIFMKPDGSIDMIHCPEEKMLGVQFHPESVMTQHGREITRHLLLEVLQPYNSHRRGPLLHHTENSIFTMSD